MRMFSNAFISGVVFVMINTWRSGSALSQPNRIRHPPQQSPSGFSKNVPASTLHASSSDENIDDYRSVMKNISPVLKTLQLTGFSFLLALLVISWEDLSMAHPMRITMATQPLESTVRGLAFGNGERQRLQLDIEPEQLLSIPSYNEVMLKHRTQRVPSWEGRVVSRQDIQNAVRTIQLALLFLDECKTLANEYEWDSLATYIQKPILHSDMEQACGILKRADGFLSVEARDEVGFDWGRWVQCLGW